MTYPVSPSETIAKAGSVYVFRDANYQRRWTDKPKIGATEYVCAADYNALALQLEAMQREMAEKDAEASWHPITTCPIREPVDLWCVYGGEEFAQYDGGASIGKVVPNRHKTEEYGFFGNQSNDGVPQGHARDLIPVAWRKAVPQCPSELIAEVLGIPRTIEDARALIGGGDD